MELFPKEGNMKKQTKKARREKKVAVEDLDAKKNPKGGGGQTPQPVAITKEVDVSTPKLY
jgi:type VI protein secretion system component Hcp